MVAVLTHQDLTPEEYLEFERQSDEKHEYIGGQLYQMAGASKRHVQLTSRLTTLLSIQIGNRPCDVLASDMRVQVRNAYFYPDVTVACEDGHYIGEREDTLLNPSVVIEVLSPSTQDYDRGSKWQEYRQITNLQDYLLVSQDKMQIEHYNRTSETSWNFQEYTNDEDVIVLESVGCELKLGDIYRMIVFPKDSDSQ